MVATYLSTSILNTQNIVGLGRLSYEISQGAHKLAQTLTDIKKCLKLVLDHC